MALRFSGRLRITHVMPSSFSTLTVCRVFVSINSSSIKHLAASISNPQADCQQTCVCNARSSSLHSGTPLRLLEALSWIRLMVINVVDSKDLLYIVFTRD